MRIIRDRCRFTPQVESLEALTVSDIKAIRAVAKRLLIIELLLFLSLNLAYFVI